MILHKLFKKHLQNVKFYPRADNFTHALHVMHVTNIMSDSKTFDYFQKLYQLSWKSKTMWSYHANRTEYSVQNFNSMKLNSQWKCNLQIQPPSKSTLTLASQLFTAPKRPVCWQINSRTCTLQELQLALGVNFALFTLSCKFGAEYRSMVVDCQWKCNAVSCWLNLCSVRITSWN